MSKLTPQEKFKIYNDRVQTTSRLDPKVSILLYGEEFYIEFDMGTLRVVKDRLGVDILSGGIPVDRVDDRTFMYELLAEGLRKNHHRG